MFTPELDGTALALAAGWGNLGGGVSLVVMGSILFPLLKIFYGETGIVPNIPGTVLSDSGNAPGLGNSRGVDPNVLDATVVSDHTWRTVCIIPGLCSMIYVLVIVHCSDDSPKGNYRKRKRMGLMPSVSGIESLKSAARHKNTWLLSVQYACCFGVELTMTNAAALSFKDEFGQTTESAAAIASAFSWMNLFARGIGGFVSDIMNAHHGMKGRLLWQSISFILEGATVVIFGFSRSLAGAIVSMIVHSLFVQTSKGSTFTDFFKTGN